MRVKATTMIAMGLMLLSGILFGMLVQRSVGLGNIIRAVGFNYPTRTPETEVILRSPALLPGIPQEHQGNLALFILAGQSNMSGYAPLPGGHTGDPRAFMFGNNYRWDLAKEPVDSAEGQVDPVSYDNAGFGPSLAFALASLELQPDTPVGLIPCAKGASSIAEWQRNVSDQSLYGSCLKRARAASPMGYLAGILFFQGEQDAINIYLTSNTDIHPEIWSQMFSTFVEDLRADLEEPDLPVVYAQLGAKPEGVAFPNWDVVKQQQLAVDLPGSAMIVTDDLEYFDGLHFTAESYREIGKRFADAYWQLVLEGE
jgi:hypothetical protein